MFVLYIQPLSNLIKRHSLSVHLFADDIQIETSNHPIHVHSAISSVETCISDVKYWMIENKLQLNDEKTECLLIRPNKCTRKLNCTSLSFGHNVISFSTTAKNLGFHFTDDMRIDAHVQDIYIQDIDIHTYNKTRHKTRHTYAAMFTLTYDALAPFVTSPLMQQKPCSVPLCFLNLIILILFSMVAQCICWKDFRRFKIQQQELSFDFANKITFHPFSCLHWLPINARIEYNLSVICHSFFLGLSPIYLSDLLLVYTPKRNLRSSSDNRILCIHKLRTKTFGHRSFSFAAPTIWKSLPSELRHTDSIQKFKLALKNSCFLKFYT